MKQYVVYLIIYFLFCFLIIFRSEIEKVLNYIFVSKKYELRGKIISFYKENQILFDSTMDENIVIQRPYYITLYFIVLKNKNGELYNIKIPKSFFKVLKKGKKVFLKTFKKDWENIYVHRRLHI